MNEIKKICHILSGQEHNEQTFTTFQFKTVFPFSKECRKIKIWSLKINFRTQCNSNQKLKNLIVKDVKLEKLLPLNTLPPFNTHPVFLASLVYSKSWSYLPIYISPGLNGLSCHFATFNLATPVNHNDIIIHLDSDSTVTGGLSITVFVESPHLK